MPPSEAASNPCGLDWERSGACQRTPGSQGDRKTIKQGVAPSGVATPIVLVRGGVGAAP